MRKPRFEFEKGAVYWLGGRTFIAGRIGRPFVTGLVIEADGLHSKRVPAGTELPRAKYRGEDYPQRKMRGHLRKMKTQTQSAKAIRADLLEQRVES